MTEILAIFKPHSTSRTQQIQEYLTTPDRQARKQTLRVNSADQTDLVNSVFLTRKSLKASFIALSCQRPEVALRGNIFEANEIPYLC